MDKEAHVRPVPDGAPLGFDDPHLIEPPVWLGRSFRDSPTLARKQFFDLPLLRSHVPLLSPTTGPRVTSLPLIHLSQSHIDPNTKAQTGTAMQATGSEAPS